MSGSVAIASAVSPIRSHRLVDGSVWVHVVLPREVATRLERGALRGQASAVDTGTPRSDDTHYHATPGEERSTANPRPPTGESGSPSASAACGWSRGAAADV